LVEEKEKKKSRRARLYKISTRDVLAEREYRVRKKLQLDSREREERCVDVSKSSSMHCTKAVFSSLRGKMIKR